MPRFVTALYFCNSYAYSLLCVKIRELNGPNTKVRYDV